MAIPRILHMFVPGSNVSPFDVNMAVDAGFEVVVPYTGVQTDKIVSLIQDAIFSRPPKRFRETGIFIGGWDVNQAAEMIAQAPGAMVPPFEVSVFADPNGAYSTAAALVALLERALVQANGSGLAGCNAIVFGGGPVGLCSAVLLAQHGGQPRLARLTKMDAEREAVARRFCARYGVDVPWIPAGTDADKVAALATADVVVAAAKAGIRILTADVLAQAPALKVALDVNAVPPSGIEGIEGHDTAAELPGGALGIGALTVGNIKYKVQAGLLTHMQEADEAMVLDFPQAFTLARTLV